MVNGQRTTVNRLCPFFLMSRSWGIWDFGILGIGIGYTVPELVEGKSSALRQAQ